MSENSLEPRAYWADPERSHQRAIEIAWALDPRTRIEMCSDPAVFAVATAIEMREELGEDFAMVGMLRGPAGEFIALSLRSRADGLVSVTNIDPVKAAALAQKASEEGRPPTDAELGETALESPGSLDLAEATRRAIHNEPWTDRW